MKERPIGVFDSGVGGLTAVRELHKLMPNENIVYFGDTGRAPYGSRSKETIVKYSKQAVNFLMKQDVKAIIAACGTISTSLDEKTVRELCADVPYAGIIMPSTRMACAMSSKGRIGVVATPAVIRTGAYGRAIRAISPSAKVFGNACAILAPLVEAGMTGTDNQITRLTIEMYLAPLIREEIDTLILGCTHYPLLYDLFNDILEYKVTLIDPCVPAVREAQASLAKLDMLNPSPDAGKTRYYVTDAVEQISSIAKIFLQEDISGSVTHVAIEDIDV